MKKVMIIGCGGSGKSTLATALGEKLELPVTHLDRLFWKPGWIPSPENEFREAQMEVLEQDAWIVDGNYSGTMEARMDAADTIIFLDMPLLTCFFGVIRRYLSYRNTSRPDMTDGNREQLPFEFLAWILTFRKQRRPRILRMLQAVSDHKRVVTLTTRSDVDAFLEGVTV